MPEFTPPGFRLEDLSSTDVQRLRAIYEPLARSVRELVDATIRTEAEAEAVSAAVAEIDAATARLRSRQIDGGFGVRYTTGGHRMPWGNAAIGIRNPIAPPLVVQKDGSGRAWADVELGAAYEGPPGQVHGGVCAMVLDHLLGEVAADPVKPRFTGTLTVRYLRTTALGWVHAEARVVRTEGVKAFAEGHIADERGRTVEAEGVLILPKWARG